MAPEISTNKLSLSTLHFIQGDKFDFEANKYYVIEFWESWCPPCVQNIPHLNELYIKYKDYINLVGVTCDNPVKLVNV